MILRRSLGRISVILAIFFLILWAFFDFPSRPTREKLSFNKLPFDLGKKPDTSSTDVDPDTIKPSLPAHAVDQLVTRANERFDSLLAGESKDVTSAAAVYRLHRGRHPPPDFGRWVEFAREKNALIIEDLFDQIYHDLEPFWAISPKQLQRAVAGLEYIISIRNGSLTTTDSHDGHLGIGVWTEMFQQLKGHLPDVDLGFNVIDEPRLLVPWDNIDGYMKTAARRARLITNGSLPSINEFQPLAKYESTYYDHQWMQSGNYWVLARDTCPPESPGRRAEAVTDFVPAPEFSTRYPEGSFKGYVANWTLAKDPCTHPHIRGMHGTFIAPRMMKTSKDLFPVFGGSKLSMNNDILLPPPEYWTEAAPEEAGEKHWWDNLGITSDDWKSKQTKAFWRGPATGGKHRRETWTRFQRHRFVSMMNSSHVDAALTDEGFPPHNFPLPDNRRTYRFIAAADLSLDEWIGTFADAAFTDLMCFDKAENQTSCDYSSKYYSVAEDEDLWRHFGYKYLPDIDGDAFSKKYLAILRSTSLPIKATIYNEWHDSRLIPWKHFVPMDNTFVDFWAIMDYFLSGRDAVAKKIAADGKKWANTVLRQEDMLVYIYRLVIEYARIMNDDREKMGFIADLRKA